MENFKLSIESVTFSVNNKKDTICKVKYKPSVFLKRSTFYAKARLHKGDDYVAKMGERIAFAKAERKAYKHARNQVKRDIREIESVLEAAKAFFEKANGCFEHNNKYIKQLCGC